VFYATILYVVYSNNAALVLYTLWHIAFQYYSTIVL
jgi:hypothetical protein